MRRLRLPAALLLALATLASLLVAGCGSEGDAGADPSTVTPSSSLAFVELTVRPEGAEREQAEAFLRQVLRREPGPELERLASQALRGGNLDFSEDVKPWLGERAALAVTGTRGGVGQDADAAFIVATTDTDAAADAIGKAARANGSSTREREYKGVTMIADTRGSAGAIVGPFAVLGTDRAVRAVIDTEDAGRERSLADSSTYRDARRKLSNPDDLLVSAYLDTPRLVTLLRRSAPPSAQGVLESSLSRFGSAPAVAGLALDDDTALIEAVGPATPGVAGTAGAASALVEALPRDSWLAAASAGFGQQVRQLVTQFSSAGGVSPEILEGQVRELTGLGLQRDLLGWLGSASLYAAGTNVLDLSAALTIQTSDAAASRRAVAALEKVVQRQLKQPGVQVRPLQDGRDGFEIISPQLPVASFQVIAGDDEVTIGVRPAQPGSRGRLADNDEFRRAAEALGSGVEPSFYVGLPPLVNLLGAVAGGDPSFSRARPYLDTFAFIAAGSKREGASQVQRIAIGLR